jgi:hypothetical protein
VKPVKETNQRASGQPRFHLAPEMLIDFETAKKANTINATETKAVQN